MQRRVVVATGKKMADCGYVVATEGNLSVRLGGHCFLVTPAGLAKGQLRVQDIVEVDGRGRTAQGKPTSEWPLHLRIYAQRDDVGGICHAHPPWSTAFAATGRDLSGALLTESAALLPRVPVTERALPGTVGLAASLDPFLADHSAILLGGHGVVTMGVDLGAAFALLETVERLAQVTLLAELAAGAPVQNAAVRKLLDRAK